LYIGYFWRVYNGDLYPPFQTVEQNRKLNQLRLGKFKGTLSFTSDMLSNQDIRYTWPHKNSYGACLGYTDGHGEWVPMRKQDHDLNERMAVNRDEVNARIFWHYYWFAVDAGDLPFLTDSIATGTLGPLLTRWRPYP
jgi:hypothetical protein